jgi:hypothetical protein
MTAGRCDDIIGLRSTDSDRPGEPIGHGPISNTTTTGRSGGAIGSDDDLQYLLPARLRRLAPEARIFFIDCLTLLPDRGFDAPPISWSDVDLGRPRRRNTRTPTVEGAAATGCEIVRAGATSRSHHVWSSDPWTMKGAVPPNAARLRAVAGLVAAQVCNRAPQLPGNPGVRRQDDSASRRLTAAGCAPVNL